MLSVYTTKLDESLQPCFLKKLNYFGKNYQQKIMNFRRWQDGQLSLLGRFLLLKGLYDNGIEIDPGEIVYASHGKPFLKGAQAAFNISHSGEIVVCAISLKPHIGIDLEEIRPLEIRDFRQQFTLKEWEELMYSPQPSTDFFNFWTRKEAVLKAKGIGLTICPATFDVRQDSTKLEGNTYYLQNIPIHPGYQCHISTSFNLKQKHIRTVFTNCHELLDIY